LNEKHQNKRTTEHDEQYEALASSAFAASKAIETFLAVEETMQ
jgi:hypothetical protein